MAKKSLIEATLVDLLCQALETEQGGVTLYEAAITRAQTAADCMNPGATRRVAVQW